MAEQLTYHKNYARDMTHMRNTFLIDFLYISLTLEFSQDILSFVVLSSSHILSCHVLHLSSQLNEKPFLLRLRVHTVMPLQPK